MKCSMSAYMNGPWRCGSYSCDKGETCNAPAQNRREQNWLDLRERDNVWLRHYGLPELTIRDARTAVSS